MCRNIHWVLFDAVGTLLHADPPVAEVYEAAGRQFGSRLTSDQIEQRFREALAIEFGPPSSRHGAPTSEAAELARWQRVVASVLDDVPDAAGPDLFQELWRHFAEPQNWRVFDDVEPALRKLASRGYRLGIASNFDSRLLRLVEGMPALAACERVFVSSQIGYAKPDPRFFAAVLETLAVNPAEVLLVGDDYAADYEGAKSAGWQALWLRRKLEPDDKDQLSSLASLPVLLER